MVTFKFQNLKCSKVASIILNNDLEKSARSIYMLVLSKDLTLFNYESYPGITFMKNSFQPSWQDARMMDCKIVPL